jgi:hypothetical protein
MMDYGEEPTETSLLTHWYEQLCLNKEYSDQLSLTVTRIIQKHPQLAKWGTQKEMMEKFTKMEGQNGSVPAQLTHFPVQMYYIIY